jgi:hypothetical protein
MNVMRYFAAVLLALAVAPQNAPPAANSQRNLWIGVIIDAYQADPGLRDGPKLNANLEPVAALIAGRWWIRDVDRREPPADPSDIEGLEWVPKGAELPSFWNARLFDGRRLPLRTLGALHQTLPYEDYAATTDLAFPGQGASDDHESETKGVASIGSVNVQLFADIPERSREELLRFLAPSMLEADRNEIRTREREQAGLPDYKPAQWAGIRNRLEGARLVVDTARWASSRGESFYVVEGSKSVGTAYVIKDGKAIATGDYCTHTWTGAAARRDRDGKLHVMSAWSYLVCNELHVDHFALALLERDGESCWLSARLYEDGVERVLTRPGQMDAEPDCDIK